MENFLSPNFFPSPNFFLFGGGLLSCPLPLMSGARHFPAGPCLPNRCILRKLREGASPGGINREGPRSQGTLLGTSSLVCESSDRIAPGTRPGEANRGPPSPRARRLPTRRYFRHSGTCLTDVSAPTGPPIAGATAGYVVCVVLTSVDASRRPLARGGRSAAGPHQPSLT